MEIEYKLMEINELAHFVRAFWEKYCIFRNLNELFNNLSCADGIEKELDTIREYFEIVTDKESDEYFALDELWNYLNWYKMYFYNKNDLRDLKRHQKLLFSTLNYLTTLLSNQKLGYNEEMKIYKKLGYTGEDLEYFGLIDYDLEEENNNE